MTAVRATYRLQIRQGVTFDDAAALAPYLARLGVSHLYASPVFAAAPGSTHGYDVIDHGALDPALGGRAGFERMAAALRAQGLGLILDIVPNHMAAHADNPWWAGVLTWGSASPHARHLDIDWTAERLLLPILGEPYVDALAAGAFRAALHDGRPVMEAAGQRLPLTPPSVAILLAAAGDGFADLARAFAAVQPGAEAPLYAELAGRDAAALEAAAAALSADRAALHDLHEAQVWRLGHWRLAREALTHRRFFEVDGLVGVRVEAPDVFEDVHRLLFELVEAGLVDGVRVDHVDGLADPAAYLRRLRERLGPDRPIWVEKILHPGESLPPDWPVEGTTGYEFIADMAALLTDPSGEAALTRAYGAETGEPADPAPLVAEAKRRILTRHLAAELDALTAAALAIAGRRVETRDLGRDALRRAIIAMAQACPVYRSYVSVAGASERDRALIGAMAEAARASAEIEDPNAVDFVATLLTLDRPDPRDQAEALAFATRFQQTTGPVTAKAVEDTVFYRYNRLIGLNEVGGEPDRFGAPVAEIHARLAARGGAHPLGLLAGTTHDTKRGEDARARLHALSLAPERWAAGVARWRPMLAGIAPEGEPSPGAVWLFLQALLGAWPEGLAADDAPDDAPGDAPGLAALSARMAGYLEKALREAKAETSWTRPDAAVESAALAFAAAALDPARAGAFLADFAETARPYLAAGRIHGLAEAAIRLTAPGVPDVYQGSEAGDFSLVDPDNRRAPDFAALAAALGAGAPASPKLALVRRLLALRAEEPALFRAGALVPIAAGDDAFAYARVHGDTALLVAVPIRRAVAALAGLTEGPAPAEIDAAAPAALRGFRSPGSGEPLAADGRLRLPLRAEPTILLALR